MTFYPGETSHAVRTFDEPAVTPEDAGRLARDHASPTAQSSPAPVTPVAGPALRTLVIAGPGKPPETELRRRIAADLMPDVVSPEDAIGATLLDDRYIAELEGLRGRLLRRLPLVVAQALEALLRCREYDAIVSWSDQAAILVGAVLQARRRRPAHVTILMWPSKPKKAMLLRLALPGIDRHIVWPPLQRRFITEKLGVPADRVVEAHAPVDTNFWRPADGPADMICSVGQEMRDYGTLLEALRPLGIPCHVAAGTGLFATRFLEDEWAANVRERKLPDNVTLGRKSHVELRELYARSRFVIVPLIPTDMDNGITVIIEAFAMGRPVICTETPGQTGLLEHGVNCLRVPAFDAEAMRDAIAELWRDPERCRWMGAAGRRAVEERHSLPRWTDTLGRAVDEAIAARRPD